MTDAFLIRKVPRAAVSFVVSSLVTMLLRRIPRLGAWLCYPRLPLKC